MEISAEMKPLPKPKTHHEFAGILLDSIDEAFAGLGENVKISIYFHLETKFRLPKKEIPNRIEDFSEALEKIFGRASKQLEILIMIHLNKKVKINYKWIGPKWLIPELTFEEYMKIVKRSIEDSDKNKMQRHNSK